MNKTDFINIVADKANITKRQSEDVINIVFETLTEALVDGEKLVFSGFGTFEVVDRAERVGRNPQTGEEIKIPASRNATFKPGKQLKDLLNE